MEKLRLFLGMGVTEFTNSVIVSTFLLFALIIAAEIVVILILEKREEKRQINSIIEMGKQVYHVERLLEVHQRSGFKDLEQTAIDIVKIINHAPVKIILTAILIAFSGVVSAQHYTDLFPNSRAPYRFRIYEREVLEAKEIDTIHNYSVIKKYNRVWMQGIYPYNGDTTCLIYIGREFEQLSCNTNLYFVYPAFIRKDTLFVVPTLEGFEAWKQGKGYK